MNNKFKYLVIAALFVGVFAAAVIGYNALSKAYTPPPVNFELPDSGKHPDAGSTGGDTVPSDVETPSEDAAEPAGETEEEVLAPDFTVLDYDGADVTLSDRLAEGKPIVLNFWATWCGPCKSELPYFDKAAAEYADEVTFMLINLTDGQRETPDGVKEFMEDNGYTFPVYFDTEYSAAIPYGANSIPLTYFVTSDGVVVGGYMGAMPEETLYNYLGQLLELEKAVKETP